MIDLVGSLLSYLIVIVLTILTAFTLRGFYIYKDRNNGLLSLAFIILLSCHILPYAFSTTFDKSDTETLLLSVIINNIAISMALIILIYAIVKNINFNMIHLKKYARLGILLAIFLTVLTYTYLSIGTEDWIEQTVSLLFWPDLILSISLIVLVAFLIKYYVRTRNTNTLWIIIGFLCLFFTRSITRYSILYLFDLDKIYSSSGFMAYDLTFTFITLMGYTSLLIALIRTRVVQ